MSDSNIVTGWVSKYALTTGLVEVTGNLARGYMHVYHMGEYKEGVDFFLDKGDVLIRAEEMRLKKLVALKKQIKKMESLNFFEEESK